MESQSMLQLAVDLRGYLIAFVLGVVAGVWGPSIVVGVFSPPAPPPEPPSGIWQL